MYKPIIRRLLLLGLLLGFLALFFSFIKQPLVAAFIFIIVIILGIIGLIKILKRSK